MVYIVVAFAGGLICSLLASGKRRNPIGWFVIGFLLPLIGIILVIVLPEGSGGLEMEANIITPPARPADPRQAPIEALERLATLRDRGALSAEEFEEQKRELLASRPTSHPGAGMVTCPSCQRQVDERMTVLTGDGVLCDRCNAVIA